MNDKYYNYFRSRQRNTKGGNNSRGAGKVSKELTFEIQRKTIWKHGGLTGEEKAGSRENSHLDYAYLFH